MCSKTQVLLGNLKFHTDVAFGHGAEERMKGFARLKIYRSVFYLNNDIFFKLPVQRHKFVVGLFGPVGVVKLRVHKGSPNDISTKWS